MAATESLSLCLFCFFWRVGNHQRAKYVGVRGKNFKKLPKTAEFCHYIPTGWGEGGGRREEGGK